MKKNILSMFVLSVFTVVMVVSLFCTLKYQQVCSTDEAAHGINAYEMMVDNNYLVNTLKHQVDYYNSKPPLMLWLIMISYRIFGCTPLGMRVPSAMAGLILYLLCLLFCKKNWGTVEMLLFAAYLPACRILFDFHMFRSGDMDSVYTLFLTLAIYSIYKSYQNPFWGMAFCGLFSGLAFMTKGPHAALIAAIGILSYPLIRKKVRVKHLCLAVSVAVAVVLPWVIARYSYDGFALFSSLLYGETVGRVGRSTFSLYYFRELYREPICMIYLLLGGGGAAWFVAKKKETYSESDSFVKNVLKEIPIDIWILFIWFCVVFGGYTLAKSYLDWYIYSAFIPLGLLGARGSGYVFKQTSENVPANSKWILLAGRIVFCGVLAAGLVISVLHIKTYPFHGNDGGSRNSRFYGDVFMWKEMYGSALDKKVVYTEELNNVYKPSDEWELDLVFYAETSLDWICADGGVKAFLETDDMDVLLAFDKKLWDEYINVLAGHVILADNGYLLFSKHKYGEEDQ